MSTCYGLFRLNDDICIGHRALLLWLLSFLYSSISNFFIVYVDKTILVFLFRFNVDITIFQRSLFRGPPTGKVRSNWKGPPFISKACFFRFDVDILILRRSLYLYASLLTYIYIYRYICIHICIHIYMYIYIYIYIRMSA